MIGIGFLWVAANVVIVLALLSILKYGAPDSLPGRVALAIT